MAKYQLTLTQTPNQTFSFDAGQDSVEITFRTTSFGLFADLSLNGTKVFSGRRCVNKMPFLLNNLITGNIYFNDLYGNDDPTYDKFNSRFVLVYDEDYVI